MKKYFMTIIFIFLMSGILYADEWTQNNSDLRRAVKNDKTRAAFEAAWLAHALTDGLTPAHHYPYQEAVSELMSDKEYVTIFGQPVKGIMHGKARYQVQVYVR